MPAMTTSDSSAASADSPPAGEPAEVGRPRRRFGAVALAIAVAVGLLFGYAVGWLVPRLTQPGDDSVEAGFARDMIVHHAQAVEMGLLAFQKSDNPDVRQLAVDVATAQQGEMGMMHAWLAEWGLDPTGAEPAMAWMPEDMRLPTSGGPMPGMASAEEMAKLRAASGRELDILFLQLMIRHHLGGVHMLDAVLETSDVGEVVDAATTMKSVQDGELTNLQNALKTLGGTPLPAN
jgi:uncharacterized protein (DUF305 family)